MASSYCSHCRYKGYALLVSVFQNECSLFSLAWGSLSPLQYLATAGHGSYHPDPIALPWAKEPDEHHFRRPWLLSPGIYPLHLFTRNISNTPKYTIFRQATGHRNYWWRDFSIVSKGAVSIVARRCLSFSETRNLYCAVIGGGKFLLLFYWLTNFYK